MINTHLIARFIEMKIGDKQGFCKMCGGKTEQGFLAKNYIKDARFTNSDLLKRKDSSVICEYCAACLKDDKLRRSSFICSESGIVFLQKNDIENVLFNMQDYVSGEFIVCITKSFKKHNSFRARINRNTKTFYIREEDDEYVFDVKKLKPVYDAINKLYLYFTKEEIQSGKYDTNQIRKYLGIDEVMRLDNIINDYRKSKQFELLLHILNSEKRNEIVKQRIKEEKEHAKQAKKSESTRNSDEFTQLSLG